MSGLVDAVVAGVAAALTWTAVSACLQRRRDRREDARWAAFVADFRGAGQQARARNQRAS